jgi:hypothetical protein
MRRERVQTQLGGRNVQGMRAGRRERSSMHRVAHTIEKRVSPNILPRVSPPREIMGSMLHLSRLKPQIMLWRALRGAASQR